jgi:predicted NBD/HSP70 family sugar kinase
MSSSHIQPGLLRKMTVRKVLEALQEHGPLSRADLTRETGISAPTVSKVVSDLLETGLLEEGEAPDKALGRPGKKLQLARDAAYVVGVVLAPDVCQVVSASLDGTIDDTSIIPIVTPGNYDALIGRLAEAIEQITSKTKAEILGIGISVPGLVDEETGESLFSPNLHVINRRRPSSDLTAMTGISAVCMQENRAFCLGERLYGKTRGLENFAVLDVTTGLGLGVFSNGELIRGHNGLACELGHLTVDPSGRLCGCGNRGCLETLATDTAFATAVSERLGRKIRIDELLEGLRSGDLQARDELNRVSEYLSIAMAAAINLFNPSTLFVFGQFLSLNESTLEQVIRMTRRRTLGPSFEKCKIELATVDKEKGAIATIVHHLTQSAGAKIER